MCGIVGLVNFKDGPPIDEAKLRQMLALIRHRGPDQFGVYLGDQAGLGSARLSIIDLSSGQQPISNEDETMWIVFNGEIFNYVELRPELEKRGHRFSTNTDTEIILHLYEDYGPECLSFLNGQFAIAIWDERKHTLFLARDRLGIRPIFYTNTGDSLLFGSEIKTLLADTRVKAEFDPIALDQIFTYWSTLSPRTAFQGIQEVPAGHYMLVKDGNPTLHPYWQVEFPTVEEGRQFSRADRKVTQAYLEEFRALLIDATQIRLRADVPVGAYLSGGLDSSATTAVIRNYTQNRLDTFSIAFKDPQYDESAYQYQMADFLGTEHKVIYADYGDVGEAFLESMWHIETPILRTSPAPLYLLSRLVRQSGYKVVMTGEGADEFLAGYNIFKEAKIRRFWARQPNSQFRPALLQKLYPYIANLGGGSNTYIQSFFGYGLAETNRRDYSHAVRWHNTSRARRFFSDDQKAAASVAPAPPVFYPPGFSDWDPLSQAQYLEISIFLSQYLLSSQGDRVGMAHSVEGRFPFLDYRLVEFCNKLPPVLKLNGLTEKYLLKKTAQDWLPEEIWRRPKRPYRAPIQHSFFNPRVQEQVSEYLSPENIRTAGIFKPTAVQQLATKAASETRLSETDEMALAGILSTQVIYEKFLAGFRLPAPLAGGDDVKVCDRRKVQFRQTRSL
jgi:asparagine synthase (glutamine-hydrolysing)